MDESPNSVGIEQLSDWAAHKKEDRRPKRIGLYLAGADMAAFVRQSVVAAALVRRFPGPHVFAVFRPEPPSRRFVTACHPYLHATMEAPEGSPVTIPIDWFDHGAYAPVYCSDPYWKEQGFTNVDLFLMPGVLGADPGRVEGLAENPPVFRLPSQEEQALLEELERTGLDRRRWFACLDAQALDIGGEALVGHLTRELKGQVVRLGRPADPTPCPKGVIGLDGRDEAFALRCAALSRARFVIGADAELLALASAFAVPCAGVNLTRYADRMWNAEDIVLAKRLRLADGRELDTAAAFSARFLDGEAPPGSAWLDRGPEDLIAIADDLAQRSPETTAWRVPGDDAEVETCAVLSLPLRLRDRPLLRFW